MADYTEKQRRYWLERYAATDIETVRDEVGRTRGVQHAAGLAALQDIDITRAQRSGPGDAEVSSVQRSALSALTLARWALALALLSLLVSLLSLTDVSGAPMSMREP